MFLWVENLSLFFNSVIFYTFEDKSLIYCFFIKFGVILHVLAVLINCFGIYPSPFNGLWLIPTTLRIFNFLFKLILLNLKTKNNSNSDCPICKEDMITDPVDLSCCGVKKLFFIFIICLLFIFFINLEEFLQKMYF